MLLLPYRVFDLVFADSTRSWFVGICGSSVLSNRRGEDAYEILGDTACCEVEDDGCTEHRPSTLEGMPRRMPTDTILAVGDMVIH